MAYKISYKKSITKDLKKIDKKQCLKLLNKIETDILKKPESGQELTGNFSGLYSFRVGDYRIIYSIISDNKVIILRIAHRKEVYKQE